MGPRKLNTQRIIKTFYRSWWRRPLWLLVILVIVPLVVGRIALNPLLDRALRHHLGTIASGTAAADFGDIDVFLFPPSFTFRDVVVRGPSGETLDVDRLEIHVASLEDLRGPLPHVRVRMVHPQLRVVPGAGDLERWFRALPSARVDVAGIENGTISNASASDKRAFLQGVTGDIEGMTTGPAAPLPNSGEKPTAQQLALAAGWQTWLEARLDGVDPLRAFFKAEPGGAWQSTLSVQQMAPTPPSGSGPLVIEARAHGRSATGQLPGAPAPNTITTSPSDIPMKGSVTVKWSGSEAPVALAQDRVGRLAAIWPGLELAVGDVRVGAAGAGQSLELKLGGVPPAPAQVATESSAEGTAVVTDASGQTAAVAPAPTAPHPAGRPFAPFDAITVVMNLVRVSNQALLPPAPGMASLTEVPAEGEPSTDATASGH